MTTEWIFSGITRTVEDPCSWLWRHIVSDCDVTFVGATVHLLRWTPYMYASSPLKNRAWGRRSPGAALSFCSDLTLSQEFQPMAAQLSIKAALPLAKIQVRQLYCPASRTTLVATRFRVAVICPIIQVPHGIRVFFYFVWFVFINHIFQFYYELCTYCNILDIYLS